ncbi:MAG: GAF domain-containing sensor histidine kinase [Gaiellaceae bacterium]
MEITQGRLRGLVEAGIALTSELSLDALLLRLTQTAAELTGARYAALGVIDQTGSALERFITYGVDDALQRQIGDLPRGRGVLGVLINDATPLRLHDLRDDPRSVGFPPGHPEMTTFLGVPILLRGIAYGNLYLAEKEDGADFTDSDEEIVTLLAAQAAVAIENARLYESATRWSRQLESLNEVASALVSQTSLPPLLNLIAERLRDLVEAKLVIIALPSPDGTMAVAAAAGETADDVLRHPEISQRSKTRAVLERRRSERNDSTFEDPEIDQEVARRWGFTSGMWVPLLVRERAVGVIACHDKIGADPRFDDADLRLAEGFAVRASAAVELSERVQRESLRRVVGAQELERERLARELHDETGQALTSILLGLKTLEDAASDAERIASAAQLRELVVSTLQDVRRLAVELRPKALDDFGLLAAVERLAQTFTDNLGIATDVEASLGSERLPHETETALYRIVQEALTNVVKHARASRVSISLVRKSHSVSAVIEDDGVGFGGEDNGASGMGLGLVGMRERVGLLDGRLEVESRAGQGTTIVAEVPL